MQVWARIACGITAGVAFSVNGAFAGLVTSVVDTTPGGATADGTIGSGEYVGSVTGGGGGFGGPVGGATLSLDSDSQGIYLGLSNLGNFSGNSIRVYFGTTAGANTTLSTDAGFNDFGDFGRERISRPDAGGLTLPFHADYGLLISDAFGGFQSLYQLTPGGNNSLNSVNNGTTFSAPVTNGNTNATIEAFIPYANLGITAGSTVKLLVAYANNNDHTSAYLSNEGIPFQGNNTNFGDTAATFANYDQLVTVSTPEPASLAVLGLGAVGLLRRRK